MSKRPAAAKKEDKKEDEMEYLIWDLQNCLYQVESYRSVEAAQALVIAAANLFSATVKAQYQK